MQVRVKSLQGDEYLIQVQNDQTVHQFKASISEKAGGLSIDRQKLVYKGRTMQDTSLVGDYSLEEDCKVHLIVQKEPESASSTGPAANSSKEINTSRNNDEPNSTTSPSVSTCSSGAPCPMDISSTGVDNDEVIRLIGRFGSRNGPGPDSRVSNNENRDSSYNSSTNGNHPAKSRFEVILRERLAVHFPSRSIDRVMENLFQEIDADINSTSLDDLERLAKQKLNITNE